MDILPNSDQRGASGARRSSRGLAGTFPWLAILLLAILLLAACAPAPPPPVASFEGELIIGEPVRHQVTLAAGDLLSVRLEQAGSDFALHLIAPDGSRLATADEFLSLDRPEHLEVVVERGGRYTFELEAFLEGPYRLVVDEARPATAEEVDRHRRRRSLEEASRELLRRLPSLGDSTAQAREEVEELARQWLDLGDGIRAGRLFYEAGVAAWYRGEIAAAKGLLVSAARRWDSEKNPLGESFALATCGQIAVREERLGTAERLYRRALASARRGGDPRQQATVLTSLGVLRRKQGRFGEARLRYQQGLTAAQGAGAELERCRLHNRLGALERAVGRLDQARQHFRAAAGGCPTDADPGRVEIAAAAASLGVLEQDLGELDEALARYLEAEEVARALRARTLGDELLAVSLVNQANVLLARGRSAEALGLLVEAEAPAVGEQLAEVLRSRTAAYLALRDLEAAQASAARLIEVSAGKTRMLAEGYRLQGEIELLRGGSEEALDHLDRSLRYSVDVGDRRGQAATQLQRARALLDLGRLEAAQRATDAADRLARPLDDPLILSEAQARRARVLYRRGEVEWALSEVEAALATLEALRARIADPRQRETFYAHRQEHRMLQVALLRELGRPAEALAASDRARARALLEVLQEARLATSRPTEHGDGAGDDGAGDDGAAATGIAALRSLEARLDRRLSALLSQRQRWQLAVPSASASSIGDRSEQQQLDRQIADLRRQLEQLAAQLRREDPRYAALEEPELLSGTEIQRRLRPGEALLEYALGESDSFLFVVTVDRIRIFDLPPAAELENKVAALRRQIVEREALQPMRSSAAELRRSLLPPEAMALLDGVGSVIVVPDGALHTLPFEALIDEAGSFLVEERSFSYAPSFSLLASLRDNAVPAGAERPAAGGSGALAGAKLAAFGAPAYELFPQLPVEPLPQAAAEVRQIGALFSAPGLFVGRRATEEALKGSARVAAADYLHLAVHGLAPDDDLSRLSLVLLPSAADGGSEEAGQDGFLYLHEISDLQLAARLVVLSACSTGLGDRVAGEGLVNISRGFFAAGASSVVVSLWPVEDRATERLMVAFYRRLNQGKDRASALAEAKRELLEDGRWPYPQSWASFVLVGRGR